MHRLRRLAAATLAATMLAAGPALATEGLAETGATTWSVATDAGRVDVRIDLQVTHTVPDRADGSYTYWDSYGIVLPYEPQDLQVTWGGQAVTPRTSTLADGSVEVTWSLPTRLRHGQTRTAQVTASFDSAPPRADLHDGPRVQPAYLQLLAVAYGDDADITVELPTSLQAQPPAGWQADARDGLRVWTGTDVDASRYHQVLGAGTPVGTDARTITVDGAEVTIVPWANDPAWGDAVADFTMRALPAIADLVGTPDLAADVADGLEITETAVPEQLGFGGFYDPSDASITVGEDFDTRIWTHELAHHWFNHDTLSETWLIEGLADTATTTLAEDLDLDVVVPPAPGDIDPLISWDTTIARAQAARFEDPDAWDATVSDLYDGAHHVVASMRDQAGADAFDDVVVALLDGQSAWDGPGDEAVPPTNGWRELVDLLEVRTGWDGGDDLVVEYVDPFAAPAVATRDRAIVAYDELATRPWATPLAVRRAMQAWRHDDALALMGRAGDLGDDIDDLQVTAAGLGLEVTGLQDSWETGELDDLQAQVASLDELAAMVTDVQQRADRANVTLPDLDITLDPATAVRAQARTEDVARIADMVAAAMAIPRPTGLVDRVGLLGTDPSGQLDRARAALAADDLDTAASLSGAAVDTLGSAGDEGALRLGIAATIVGGVVVGMVVLVRRRARRRAGTPVLADDGGAGHH